MISPMMIQSTGDANPRVWYRPLFFERNGTFELDYINKKRFEKTDAWNRREFVKGLRTIHRNYTYTSNLIAYFQVLFEDQNTAGRTGSYSGYYDFTDQQARPVRICDRQIHESRRR